MITVECTAFHSYHSYPELICAFCWFIFVFIIENARSKKQTSKGVPFTPTLDELIWMCNIRGMLIDTGNRPTSRKTCPNTSLFTTNPSKTKKPGVRGMDSATNHLLRHGFVTNLLLCFFPTSYPFGTFRSITGCCVSACVISWVPARQSGERNIFHLKKLCCVPVNDINLSLNYLDTRRSQRPCGLRSGSAAARLLGLRVRNPQGNGCHYFVSDVCCQVGVPATVR